MLRDGYLIETLNIEDAPQDLIIKLMVGREITNQYNREYFTPGEEILRVENLSSYRFNNINLSVRRNEIVGISGLVGAAEQKLSSQYSVMISLKKAVFTCLAKNITVLTPDLLPGWVSGLSLKTENRGRYCYQTHT